MPRRPCLQARYPEEARNGRQGGLGRGGGRCLWLDGWQQQKTIPASSPLLFPSPFPLVPSLPHTHMTLTQQALTHPHFSTHTHTRNFATQVSSSQRRNHGKSNPSFLLPSPITPSLPFSSPPSPSPLSLSLYLPSLQPQPFVKVLKNKQYFKRYQTKFRRRRGTWGGAEEEAEQEEEGKEMTEGGRGGRESLGCEARGERRRERVVNL